LIFRVASINIFGLLIAARRICSHDPQQSSPLVECTVFFSPHSQQVPSQLDLVVISCSIVDCSTISSSGGSSRPWQPPQIASVAAVRFAPQRRRKVASAIRFGCPAVTGQWRPQR